MESLTLLILIEELMDYIVIKDVALLVFMAVCIGLSFYSSIKMSRDVKEESNKSRDSMMELLKHSIDTIKSSNLEERVNAAALEGEHEIKLEMLKDAYAQEEQMEEGSPPQYAHTDDGMRIDLKEYEVM